MEKIEPKYNRDRKTAKNHHIVTLLGIAAVVLLLIFVSVILFGVQTNIGKLQETVNNGVQAVAQLSEELAEEAETPPASEATTPSPAETYSFEVDIALGEGELSTSYDFGDYAQNVTTKSSWNMSEESKTWRISCKLGNETAERIDLSFAEGRDGEGDRTLEAGFNMNLDLFEDCEATYKWQYCNALGIWSDVDEDMISSEGGTSCFTCSGDWLEDVIGEEESAEFRCRIRLKNRFGDTMTITICGITATLDRTETNN